MHDGAGRGAPGEAPKTRRRILVVDGSKVVRATLVKRLGSHFDIIEEEDGESAWQRLMLDGSIVALIAGMHPPRLNTRDLLSRLRASAMRRLRETPCILLVSDIAQQADSGEWPDVAGFMTKTMTTAQMTDCLTSVFLPPPVEEPTKAAAPMPVAQATPVLDAETFAATLGALPLPDASEESLCMLVFGIDHLDALIARFGAEIPAQLSARIARLLASKVDPGDQLGWCGDHRLAIISRGVDQRLGLRFGRRVCKSLAGGQIAVQGQKIRLTVSVGVAATTEDHADTATELLAIAQSRLEQAMVCGGNQACSEHRPDCPLHHRSGSMATLMRVLTQGVSETGQKEVLGLEILPLLQTLDERLALGLSLSEVETRLRDISAKKTNG